MSTAETMVRTKIARIISPTQVVLAAGSDHGVRKGMEFIIYELTDPIQDPETGEDLGQLELVKGRVQATHVQEKVTLASTRARQVTRRLPSLEDWIGGRFGPRSETVTETAHEELPLDPAVAATQSEPTVKVGDLVRSVS